MNLATSELSPSNKANQRAFFRDGRWKWFFAALTFFAITTFFAFKQPLRPDPFTPVERLSADWWLYPLETNAYKRLPIVYSDLNSVFSLPNSEEIWAVGGGGLIIHSGDAGKTWKRQNIEPDMNSEKAAETASLSQFSVGSFPNAGTQQFNGKSSQKSKPDSSFQNLNSPKTANQDTGIRILTVGKKGGSVPSPRQSATKSAPKSQTKIADKRDSSTANSPALKRDYKTIDLRSVQFIDSQHGWVVGDLGTILKTDDGGVHWEEVQSGVTKRLCYVQFNNLNVGWAVSIERNVIHTTDGGHVWNSLNVFPGQLTSADFVTPKTGWVVGSGSTKGQGFIFATVNEGASWINQLVTHVPLNSVRFVDPQRGWVVGDSGLIMATTDGGGSWKSQISGKATNLRSVFFEDSLSGWVVGDTACILSTSDGGRTWRSESTGTSSWLTSVHFTSKDRGWAVGSGGAILGTNDRGQSWHSLVNGDPGTYHAVDFVDEKRGWIVGDYGRVMATVDGGQTWTCQESGTITDLYAASFPDVLTGWAVGSKGTMLSTFDGGQHWRSQPYVTQKSLFDVHFLNETDGWALGLNSLYGTSDGGQIWTVLDSSRTIHSVQFVDANTGWARVRNSLVTTTNGGRSWRRLFDSLSYEEPWAVFHTLDFIDSSRGWVINGGRNIWGTTNKGYTWNPLLSNATHWLWSVHFVDSARGWAVGDSGTILATVDGGLSWRPQMSNSSSSLFSVKFVNANIGWCVGTGGTLRATRDGGRTWSDPTSPASRSLPPWYFASLLIIGFLFIPVVKAQKPMEAANESVADVLISDRPLSATDPDPLDFKSVASGLSRFLRNENTQPPLTIAITGQWGSGKSSLMNLLKSDLQRYGFRPVWFNAWHHQKEEHLLAALLENVRKQAIPPWWRPEALIFRARLFWSRVRLYWPVAVMLLMSTSFIVGYFAADYPSRLMKTLQVLEGVVKPEDGILQSLQNKLIGLAEHTPLLTMIASLAATLLVGWRWLRAFGVSPVKLMSSMSGKFNFRDLKEQVEFRTQFAQEFSEVTAALNPRTMLVLIDDLDRCRPENVLEVLEAVNFLITSGDCFVVLGLDLERVERCVGLGFKDVAEELIDSKGEKAESAADNARKRRSEFAQQYLEKLINIEVPVPIPTQTQSENLILTEKVGGQSDSSFGTRLRKNASRVGKNAFVGVLVASALTFAFLLGRDIIKTADHDGDFQAVLQPLKDGSSGTPVPIGTEIGRRPSATPTAASQQELSSAKGGKDFVEFRSPTLPNSSFTMVYFLAAFLLSLGIWRLSMPSDLIIKDSPEFIEALKIWHPLLVAKSNTPRSIKRFVNRVRYGSMQVEPKNLEGTLWQRINRAFGIELLQTKRTVDEKELITESILVALSAVHHADPALIETLCDQNIKKNISIWKVESQAHHGRDAILDAFTQAVANHLKKFKNLPVAPGARERYEVVSRGVRIH